MDERVEKHCAVCGRRMEWRRKWRKSWNGVIYCSKACRRSGLTESDQQLETAILGLLKTRPGKTICPSEAAITVAGAATAEAWRQLMPAARNAARRLVVAGKLDILQRGRPVDPSTARGPIRLRLRKDAFYVWAPIKTAR